MILVNNYINSFTNFHDQSVRLDNKFQQREPFSKTFKPKKPDSTTETISQQFFYHNYQPIPRDRPSGGDVSPSQRFSAPAGEKIVLRAQQH